jgi:multidrug efflux pump subunit AcrA (membrane-fusion protein)
VPEQGIRGTRNAFDNGEVMGTPGGHRRGNGTGYRPRPEYGPDEQPSTWQPAHPYPEDAQQYQAQPQYQAQQQYQKQASGIAVYQNGYRPATTSPARPPSSSPRSPASPTRPAVSPTRSAAITRPGGRHAWRARLGAMIIAGSGVAGVIWYVPHVMDADHSLLTGTVSTTGTLTLNFPYSGEINQIKVQNGETVHKGQLLATLIAPQAETVVTADKAAVTAEQERIAQLKSQKPAPADQQDLITADQATLSADQAQLANDEQKLSDSEIKAPQGGTVTAVNGEPGETVTSQGIKEYTSDNQQASSSQRPAFSLLPEGPQSSKENGKASSELPVIAIRTSDAWQVNAMVPEDSATQISAGSHVLISVPSANISNVPGTIEEVEDSPVSTTSGIEYQVVVNVDGSTPTIPLNGMAADVRLSS